MRMLNETEENDVSVSFSDQQSINAFSRYNNRVTDYEEDLKRKREEKEAVEEVMMELELVDEEEEVLYKIADSFVHLPQPKVISLLEKETTKLDEEIEALKARVDECEEEMKKLKVVLYGKFGSNINLERD
ncbi:Prefoldin, subunit 4 [Microstroma glucosiphilum]|uniref:Prefoldin subunit 4 n=1 Tax=Pseudomicrostroma glucosiphilum TaxID=1684307 RepID=A0A316UAG4_9BASI|nr:Prefoldin, subunit 4 [Pseudomicrostroma glucosiphilum]PWN22159.1 Prefoldin, subunit 4 [Pseudomicrostroma glucosiphilum]